MDVTKNVWANGGVKNIQKPKAAGIQGKLGKKRG